MAVVSETPRRPVDRAFEHLYRKHVAAVYRYSLAVLGDPSDAEDVTQTTFLNAYRAYVNGQRPRTAENWLITIAHNVCRQRFRQAQGRPYEVELAEDSAESLEPDESVPTPEEIRRAFEQLAPRQRAALVMRELEGRNYEEIAAVLGLSTTALETLLFRARRSLREQLEEQLSCREAAFAISKQMDGELGRRDARALKRHLRSCPVCRELAQTQTRHRQLLRGLLAVPVPSSLHSFFGHGAGGASAAAGGAATAAKVAGVVAAVTVAGGGVYEAGVHVVPSSRPPAKPALVTRVTRPWQATPRYRKTLPRPAAARARQATPLSSTTPRPASPVATPVAPAAHATAVHATSVTAPAVTGRALGRTKAHPAAAHAHAAPPKARPQAPDRKAAPQKPARIAPASPRHAHTAHETRAGPPTRATPSDRPVRGEAADSLMRSPRLPSPRGPSPPHSP